MWKMLLLVDNIVALDEYTIDLHRIERRPMKLYDR